MNRPFTGRHMLVLMLAFFGTVIAVNLVMATFAVRTFGGTVVDNSYVASQRFNGWLEEARAQQALGWEAGFALDADRRIVASVAGPNGPLDAAIVSASAAHPVGRSPDLVLAFDALGDGRYRSATPLPEGRWNLRVSIARDGQAIRLIETLQ
jgi:nitrogen fixation protein FixH